MRRPLPPPRRLPAALSAVVCVALLGAACGESADDSPPVPAGDRSPPTERPERSTAAPSTAASSTASPSAAPTGSSPVARPDLPEAPASGCRFGAPVRVWETPAWVDVVGVSDSLLLAGTAAGATSEEAFLVRLDPGAAPRTIARAVLERPVPVDHRRAAPALAVEGGRGALALVDGQRRLLLATFDVTDPSLELTPFSDGASLRFSPAVASRASGWAVAWTDDRATPMRVRAALAGAGGQPSGPPRDLTAAGGGAAAPVFVHGADALVFVDPRQGMSVAHRVPLTDDGFGPTEVARPVSLVAEPPQIAAVRVGSTGWLAYTAVGAAATTAVGLVRLDATTPPVALVPGTGYGALHVDGAVHGAGAVFAADAPRGSSPDAPRVIHVRALASDGALGEPSTVVGPGGSGARARLAVADSAVGITFTDTDGTYVTVGRCALGAPAP